MNDALASYVIEAVYNAHTKPELCQVRQYLIEPCADVRTTIVIHYRMLDSLTAAIKEDRAVDALNIFDLIWWDMNVSSAQYMFNLMQDMVCDPDDDLSGYTVIQLSHTMVARFPTLGEPAKPDLEPDLGPCPHPDACPSVCWGCA